VRVQPAEFSCFQTTCQSPRALLHLTSSSMGWLFCGLAPVTSIRIISKHNPAHEQLVVTGQREKLPAQAVTRSRVEGTDQTGQTCSAVRAGILHCMEISNTEAVSPPKLCSSLSPEGTLKGTGRTALTLSQGRGWKDQSDR